MSNDITEAMRMDDFRANEMLSEYIWILLEDLQLNENALACEEERDARETGTIYTVCDETYIKCRDDVAKFREAAGELLEEAVQAHGYSWDQAGSDFYLTRVGHGVGFWDRGLNEIGDTLTAMVGHGTAFPSIDPYIGDDGEVYL